MTYEEFYKEQYPVLLKAEEQLKNLITSLKQTKIRKRSHTAALESKVRKA